VAVSARWVIGRFAGAGAPGWAAPARDELSDHFTEQFLGYVSPEAIAQALQSLADKLREDLVLIDADSSRLSAKFAGLRVDAAVEPEAPHRLCMLRFFPDAEPVTDPRVTRPGPSDHRARHLTAVLCLVAGGVVGLDDPVNGQLRSLRLADDAVTVRELLAHTGGVDSPLPSSLWADSVADVADVLGRGRAVVDRAGTSASGPAGGRCCPGNSPPTRCARRAWR
jgi:Beta-lactamase